MQFPPLRQGAALEHAHAPDAQAVGRNHFVGLFEVGGRKTGLGDGQPLQQPAPDRAGQHAIAHRRRHHVPAETRDQVGGGETDGVPASVQKDRVVRPAPVRLPKRYHVVQIAQRLDAREGGELVPPRPRRDDGGEAVRPRRQSRSGDADGRHRIRGRRQSPRTLASGDGQAKDAFSNPVGFAGFVQVMSQIHDPGSAAETQGHPAPPSAVPDGPVYRPRHRPEPGTSRRPHRPA